jgi:hypothetical protein
MWVGKYDFFSMPSGNDWNPPRPAHEFPTVTQPFSSEPLASQDDASEAAA